MNRFRDTVRFILLSPEIVCTILPLVAYTYCPSLADVLIKPMKDGLSFGLASIAIPLAMLAFNYKEGLDMLAPTGERKLLLDWPDYPHLKARVIASFIWCILGSIFALTAVLMVATDSFPRLAVAILAGGILASAAATATIALARFTIREIIGE